MLCKCVRCGIEFEARTKTAVCKDCHTAVCCVCKEIFVLNWPYTQKTCSSKCRGIYRKQSGISKEVARKSKVTLSARYGTENFGNTGHIFHKICAYCGKSFDTTSSRRRYCTDVHYGPCPICGKPSKISDMNSPVPTCSTKCKQAKIAATCIDKYGCSNALNSEHSKMLAKSTCMEKYGVAHYSKTAEYKEKYKETSLEKYGVDHPNKSPEILSKIQSTNIERYGGIAATCDSAVVAKSMQTQLDKYGGVGLASPILRAKAEQTSLEKYGFNSPTKSEEVKEKQKQTMLNRYGVDNYNKSYLSLMNHIKHADKIDAYMKFKEDPETFIESNFDHTPSCKELEELIGVTDTTIYSFLIEKGLRSLITFHSSTMEIQIYSLLLQYLPENEVIRNCRSVISPYELDFYLPKYGLAIECNPTATHNSSFEDPWGSRKVSPSYHKMKSTRCKEQSVFLFHVFGYEWATRREVITSMIVNLLNRSSARIFARNTEVKLVSYKDGVEFLNRNHRQRSTNFSIGLGLYTNSNELVSLMTFNKTRFAAGKEATDTEFSYELSRFCNKLNCNVIGGASKLFSYFIKNFEFDKIISFSDIAHTRGKLYETLGFKCVRESEPSYVWVNMLDDSYLTRFSCRKSNIQRTLNDFDIDIHNHTEREIMESHGYGIVFDSGTLRWEYSTY